MKKLLLICCLVFCVGCEENTLERIEQNNKEVASGGKVIATFPDGSKIRSYNLNVPPLTQQSSMWNRQSYLVIESKDPNNKTILINGQLYAPAEHED